MNLFMLPFAGGSKYAYWKYARHAPEGLHVFPIEIPGRGSRVNEPLFTNLDDMVADIYRQIEGQLDQPYALYGHSMGALLCYLLTQKIRDAGLQIPEHLFLTGCEAPAQPVIRDEYKLPTVPFKEKLRELGGCPEDVLNNEELFSFYEPIIRADFKAVASFVYRPSQRLDIPMTVLLGTEDSVSEDSAEKWALETTHGIDMRYFPGDHFFIFNHEAEIMEIIFNKTKNRLDERRVSVS